MAASFTERRRRRNRLHLNAPERLEDRTKITESLGMFSFMAIVPAVAAMFQSWEQASASTVSRPIVLRSGEINVLPFTVGRNRADHAGRVAPTHEERSASEHHHRSEDAGDWIRLRHRRPVREAGHGGHHHGTDTGVKGGGAALGRGGYPGLGRGSITPIFVPPPPAPPAGGAGTGLISGLGTPLAGPASTGQPQSAPVAAPAAPGRGSASTIPAAPTSVRPAGPLADSSPFPVDAIDENRGIVLLNGSTNLGFNNGWEDLRAQVRDTSVQSYSWNTSGLTDATNISGTSSYRLQFQWRRFPPPPYSVTDSVSLTVTNSSNQTVQQTYSFLVYYSGGSRSTPSWPETTSPDLLLSSAPAFPTHNATVDANTGALDTAIAMPSNNPNVPPIVLAYDSQAAAPQPLIVEHHTLDPTQSVPTEVGAQLTFNGTPSSTYYYDTHLFIPGDVEQVPLLAPSRVATGRYGYSIAVTDYRSSSTTTTPSGTATVDNESGSALGSGWTVSGLEHIYTTSGGVVLTLGSNDHSLWYASSGGSYTAPAGDFATLAAVSGGGWTRTLPDATVSNFNSSGQETSSVDRNALATTYTYDSGGRLITATDPYSPLTTLAYDSGGHLQTITDPAGRVATFTHSGGALSGATLPDGSTWGYTYDSSGRMTQVTDPRSETLTVTYDSAGRVSGSTQPDATAQSFSPFAEQGYNTSGTYVSPAPALLLAQAQASYTDSNSHTTSLRPDWRGQGLRDEVTDALGNTATAYRDANGLATTTIDRLFRISQDAYDSHGNNTQHT